MEELKEKELSDVAADEIRQAFMEVKEANGFSWLQLEAQTGVSKGTLSQWGPGKYAGNNIAIAQKVRVWLNTRLSQQELKAQAPTKIGFVHTQTARRIFNMLSWAVDGRMVVIIGDPGVGKTRALKEFAANTSNTWIITLSPTTSKLQPCLRHMSATLGIRTTAINNLQMSLYIRDFLRNRNALLIFDEFQHADESTVEEIRAIFDDVGCGVAFVGNREVSVRVQGNNRTAAFAQRFSRVAFQEVFGTPSLDDVNAILNQWAITDKAERQFLTAKATMPGGGGLRTLDHVLTLASITSSLEEPRNIDTLKAAFVQLNQSGAHG